MADHAIQQDHQPLPYRDNDQQPPPYRDDDAATEPASNQLPHPHASLVDQSRAYRIHSPAFSRSLVFVDEASHRACFYIEQSNFTPNKPHLTVHADGARNGRVLGACDFRTFHPDLISIGDPSGAPNTIVTETLRCDDLFTRGHFSFEAQIAGERRAFAWRRTRHAADGVHGLRKMSNMNFVMSDLRTNKDLAVHLARTGWGMGPSGVLTFSKGVPLPRELEMWTILSLSTIIVKAEQRRRRHRD